MCPSHPRGDCLQGYSLRAIFDQERARGLPISPLCDRTAHNLAKSQIGFIEFVVRPAFSVLTAFCEVETWMDGLKINLKHWKDLAAAGAAASAETSGTAPTTAAAAPTSALTTAGSAKTAAVSVGRGKEASIRTSPSVAVQPMLSPLIRMPSNRWACAALRVSEARPPLDAA